MEYIRLGVPLSNFTFEIGLEKLEYSKCWRWEDWESALLSWEGAWILEQLFSNTSGFCTGNNFSLMSNFLVTSSCLFLLTNAWGMTWKRQNASVSFSLSSCFYRKPQRMKDNLGAGLGGLCFPKRATYKNTFQLRSQSFHLKPRVRGNPATNDQRRCHDRTCLLYCLFLHDSITLKKKNLSINPFGLF